MTRRFLAAGIAAALFVACKSNGPSDSGPQGEDALGDSGSTAEDTGTAAADAGARDVGSAQDGGSFPDATGHDALPQDAAMISDGGGLDARPGDATTIDASTFCELGPDMPGLFVPSGFCIKRYFARDGLTPRTMAFAPNGDLFVGSPQTYTPGGAPMGKGGILVIPDDNHDGVGDAMLTYAGGLPEAHGVLFRQSQTELLYTTADAVYSVPYLVGDRVMPMTPPTKIADLGNPSVQRWTHTLAESIDGSLYVSRGWFGGYNCPTDPRWGAVLKIGGGAAMNGDVMVTGMRDPMYIRCTKWGPCFGAELSDDGWDSTLAHEKLFLIHAGDNLGYPCCYDVNRPYPGAMPPATDCSQVTPSITEFTLHDTPFGFDWDHENTFPAPYTGGFFVALHGAFGSWTGEGVGWAQTSSITHEPTGQVTLFASGWSVSSGVSGRPADALFAPDGRLFVADDQGGAIYWIAPRTLRRP